MLPINSKVLDNLLKYPRWDKEQLIGTGKNRKGWGKHIKTTLVLLLLLIIAGTSGFLGHHHAVNPTSSPKFVAVTKVLRGDLTRSVTISGELKPFQEIDLHAKVAGYLKFLTVDIGDQVKKGEVIAKIETPELKADFENASAAFQDAKLNYDRLNEVEQKQPGLLAQQDVDNAKAAYKMAKAKMDRARTLMDYATISVPFNGVVTKRYADPGAMIQASIGNARQTMPVVHIAENDKLRLDFPVPEPDVPFIKDGMPIEVTISATGQKLMGKVARATGIVDDETRTMETELDIDNHDLRLVPGMYAYVTLPLETRKNVLTLPLQAVSLNGQPDVWKINSSNKIIRQPIMIGLQTAEKVEILKGLKEGDRVVFGSREMVNIGMKVRPKLMEQDQLT